MSTEERLLSTGEAARRLGLTRHTLARAVRRGDLVPALRTPGGAYRFRPAAIAAYARRLGADDPLALFPADRPDAPPDPRQRRADPPAPPAGLAALTTHLATLAQAAAHPVGAADASDVVLTDILRLITASLGVDLAFISTVDDCLLRIDYVHDRGGLGLAAGDVFPLPDTYCATMLARGEPALVIADTRADTHFAALPSTRDLGVRAYTGISLYRADGTRQGTLCTLHRHPRAVGPAELALLTLAGRVARHAIEVGVARAAAQRQADAASAAAQQLAATFEAMADGVVLCATRGEIVGTNAAFRALLATDRRPDYAALDNAARHALLDARDGAGRPLTAARMPLPRLLQGEDLTGARAMDVQFRALDGRAVQANVSGAAVRDAAGAVVGAVAVYRDVTARRTLERAVAAERDRLWAVFAHAPAMIAFLEGPTHVFAFANPTYERGAGRGGPDLIGMDIRAAFPELAGQGLYERLDAVYRTGEPFVGTEVPVRLDRAGDGRREDTVFSFTYHPVRDAAGAVAGILVHAVEVTEQVRARRLVEEVAEERARLLAAERAMRAAAEAAVRLRNDFLTVAAHDLRTPLTNMQGRVDLVTRRLRQGRDLEPAWLEAQLTSLAASVGRLLATVHELNDMTTLELGEALELDREEVDLGAFTRVVADEVAQGSGAQSLGPVAIGVAAPGAPVVVVGDRGRLARVLQNIIGNAVKYSPGGAPVAVEVQREGTAALVVVRDHGVGIPAAELPRVFERFYRASTARGIKGSGIGLSGSTAIVEQHGGTIAVESAVGAGTTVTVSLPLADPRARACGA